MPDSRYYRLVLMLLAAGLAVRIGLVWFVQPLALSIYSDMANYVQISGDILAGDWRIWHFFQPVGYPLLLAALRAMTPDWMAVLSWMQIGASGITLLLMWFAAGRAFGRVAGVLSLTVGCLHLGWISYAGFALSETIFTALLALLLICSWRVCRQLSFASGAIWGAVFFVALLFKGTHIFVVVLFLVGLLLFKGGRAWRAALAISLVVWAGLLGHGAFTLQTVGTFQMTASAGGLNFVEGKCPIKNNEDSVGARWLSPLYHQLGKQEKKLWEKPFYESGFYFRAGLDCVRENPLVLLQSLEGIPFLFIGNWMWPAGNLPYVDWIRIYEMLFAVFAIGGLCAFAVVAGPRWATPDMFLTWIVPILGLFLCVYVFKSEIRFRVPFDVWIIPLASAGWVALWRVRRFVSGAAAGDRVPPATGE